MEAGVPPQPSLSVLGGVPSTRRLAAILAADVAGYSRLMGADEGGTHERLKAHLRQLIEPKISEHRGRIVKNTGDGLLVEFVSVVDAVRCAAEVQRGMIDREPQVPEEQRIKFRQTLPLTPKMRFSNVPFAHFPWGPYTFTPKDFDFHIILRFYVLPSSLCSDPVVLHFDRKTLKNKGALGQAGFGCRSARSRNQLSQIDGSRSEPSSELKIKKIRICRRGDDETPFVVHLHAVAGSFHPVQPNLPRCDQWHRHRCVRRRRNWRHR